jgi:predicted Zn-dependent peptidase
MKTLCLPIRAAALGMALLLPSCFPTTSKELYAGTGRRISVDFPVDRYTLDNGLEVILNEDHRVPTVAINILYRVGSRDDPPNHEGMAHLYEHLMFDGSRHVPVDGYWKLLEKGGVDSANAETGFDSTVYWETVPSRAFELALWLESDRMGFFPDAMSQATLDRERHVVEMEHRLRVENTPCGRVDEIKRAALFPTGHPYLHDPGEASGLAAVTLDDIHAFARDYYRPNQASLVIAGDIDLRNARALIDKYFGPIAPGKPRSEPSPISVKLTGEKKLTIAAAVELPRVIMTWPTPPLGAPGDAELDLFARIISSKLYEPLRRDKQLAQTWWAHQSSSYLGSTFEITATLEKGASPDELIVAIDKEVEKLRHNWANAWDVEGRSWAIAENLYGSHQNFTRRANLLNEYYRSTGDPSYIQNQLTRYLAVRPAAIEDAVVKYLPADRRIVTRVVPDPSAPVSGELRGGT